MLAWIGLERVLEAEGDEHGDAEQLKNLQRHAWQLPASGDRRGEAGGALH